MAEEYQPGLELSSLRIALQKYQEEQKAAAEEKAENANLIKSSASLGKSVYDYWAMDQMGKYKELLSEKIVGDDKISRNVYETSDIYKDKSTFGISWDKDRRLPTFEKGRMFTPASERVDMNPAYQKALDESKPKIPLDDLDLNEWSLPDTEMTNPDTFFIDDIPAGTDDIGALGLPTEDIPDLYKMFNDPTITASSAPGPMTASAGLSDSYDSAGDILGSTDKALSNTGEVSKYSKLAGGTGKALGALGTAYGAYNLGTNWDEMSDTERAQGALQTIGGAMTLTGFGAPIGLGLSAIATIWDLLD